MGFFNKIFGGGGNEGKKETSADRMLRIIKEKTMTAGTISKNLQKYYKFVLTFYSFGTIITQLLCAAQRENCFCLRGSGAAQRAG